MRIAVSGTHSVGKSTPVADIHQAFGSFVHEEEPYRALRDFYPIKFGKESTRYCNGIQLFYNISRVQQYRSRGDHVIFVGRVLALRTGITDDLRTLLSCCGASSFQAHSIERTLRGLQDRREQFDTLILEHTCQCM